MLRRKELFPVSWVTGRILLGEIIRKQRKPLWNGATHLYHAAYKKGSEQAPAFFLSTMMRQAAISSEKQRKQFVWRTKMIWKRLDRFFSVFLLFRAYPVGMMPWLYGFTASLLARKDIRLWHQRRKVLAWTKGYSRFLLTSNTGFYRWPRKFFKIIEGYDGLYEIRVEVESNIYRIFCCMDDNALVVLFHGFQKKTQNTPRKEIKRAEAIKKEYFKSKKT